MEQYVWISNQWLFITGSNSDIFNHIDHVLSNILTFQKMGWLKGRVRLVEASDMEDEPTDQETDGRTEKWLKLSTFQTIRRFVLGRVHATQWQAKPVGWVVGPSVRLSVSLLALLCIFVVYRWFSHNCPCQDTELAIFHHRTCPPAHNWGSRVSGLV